MCLRSCVVKCRVFYFYTRLKESFESTTFLLRSGYLIQHFFLQSYILHFVVIKPCMFRRMQNVKSMLLEIHVQKNGRKFRLSPFVT